MPLAENERRMDNGRIAVIEPVRYVDAGMILHVLRQGQYRGATVVTAAGFHARVKFAADGEERWVDIRNDVSCMRIVRTRDSTPADD